MVNETVRKEFKGINELKEIDELNVKTLLEMRLTVLQGKLSDLKARWPAHSLKPSMIIELEGLEEEIVEVEDKLKEIEKTPECFEDKGNNREF